MSIFQRGSVWWIDVSVATPKGRVRAKHPAGSKEDARRLESKVSLAIRDGTYDPSDYAKRKSSKEVPRGKTLGDVLDEVMKSHWSFKRSSKLFFEPLVVVLKELVGEHPVSQPFVLKDAQALVGALRVYRKPPQRPISEKTIEKYIIVLQTALTKGLEWGLVEWAVNMKSVRKALEKPRERQYVLTPEVEAKVLKALGGASSKLRAEYWKTNDPQDLFVCLMDTGARVGELRQLKWEEIDEERGIIVIPPERSKNKKVGHLLVSERMRAVFKKRREAGHEQVFDLSNDDVLNIWKRVRHATGITDKDFVPHACRHTFGTRLYQDTGDIRLVQRVLRHADIKTSIRYEHAAAEALGEALAVVNARNSKLCPKVVPQGHKRGTKRGHTAPSVGG